MMISDSGLTDTEFGQVWGSGRRVGSLEIEICSATRARSVRATSML